MTLFEHAHERLRREYRAARGSHRIAAFRRLRAFTAWMLREGRAA